MPKIVTTKSVAWTVPLLDAKGKVQTTKTKFGKREVETEVHEHVRHAAGAVLEVGKDLSKDAAQALIDDGHARAHVTGIDDEAPAEADPTLS